MQHTDKKIRYEMTNFLVCVLHFRILKKEEILEMLILMLILILILVVEIHQDNFLDAKIIGILYLQVRIITVVQLKMLFILEMISLYTSVVWMIFIADMVIVKTIILLVLVIVTGIITCIILLPVIQDIQKNTSEDTEIGTEIEA